MALFGRKKQQDSVLPDEVNQYYRSQKREKTGVVLVMGILALIATLLVGLAVFFGGRFIYNKIKGDDKAPTATVQTDTSNTQGSQSADENSDEGSTDTPTGDQQVAPTDDAEVTENNSTNTGSEQGSETSNNPGETPQLGDQPQTTTILPRTGDEGQ